MTVDREQVRRDAEHAKTCANFGPDSIDAYHALAESVLGILAELEHVERANRALQSSVIANRDRRHEAERVGRISELALEKALARAEQAERERDYHAAAAEDAFIECEARLAKAEQREDTSV